LVGVGVPDVVHPASANAVAPAMATTAIALRANLPLIFNFPPVQDEQTASRFLACCRAR
jgi:hypothetical protein